MPSIGSTSSTMRPRPMDANGTYKLSRESAVTEFGRFLRKTRPRRVAAVDQRAPRGDVACRTSPCIPYETEFFEPHHFDRFLVPQGITGLWQVGAGELDLWRGPGDGRRRAWMVDRPRSQTPPAHAVCAPTPAERDPMSTVRVAVVGLGYRGEPRSNWQSPRRGRRGCDRDVERLELIQRRYPAVRPTELKMSSPRRSTSWHWQRPCRRTSRLGARRSGRSVFIEAACRVDECLELIQLAESRGLVLMPGHTFLYSPPVVAVRDLIESGELGGSTSFRRAGSTSVSTSRTSASPGTSRPTISRFCATGWTRHRSGSRSYSRLHHSLDSRRRVHRSRVLKRNTRPCRAVVARPEQAPPYDDRRLPEDGRL